MKTYVKVLLGLATLTPFVFIPVLVAAFLIVVRSAPQQGFEEYFSSYMAIGNLLCFLFMGFFTSVWVYFIFHAANNNALEFTGMRITWLLALIFLGGWIMPFYWFHHIWREGASVATSGPLGLN